MTEINATSTHNENRLNNSLSLNKMSTYLAIIKYFNCFFCIFLDNVIDLLL